jgi:hypothetical protein
MPAELAIVDEVEATINTGSAEKRLETINRVTDLFLSSAVKLNSEQIELFDNVLVPNEHGAVRFWRAGD